MKKIIFSTLILLFLLPALTLKSQEKKPPPNVEIKTVIIKGDEDWKNTGIKIKPKDKVSITATGTVYFSDGDPDSDVSPDGYARDIFKGDWPNDYLQCDDPLPENNHAGLICNLGSEDFFNGSKNKFSGKGSEEK